ncbi:MAG: tagaturonate reductase [Clostridia bacterium]|jgi:tagaturonate reductase|nr:tagaturonate reductase [Clostridia bacterium]
MDRLKRNEKCCLTERVMQFGEGNFLRGFVDWMIDRLNKENGGDYGVVLVQPLDKGLVDMINEQDGLYSLYLRGLQKGERIEETRVVECVTRGINPFSDTEEFFACAKNPDLRFIVSNTTEAGIEYKENQNPKDFAELTFPGRLTLFMKKRFDEGLKGFILLPCELIDKNGDCLKECVLKYSRDWGFGSEFEKWINEENHFTNTLVDRIVTGYPRDTAAEMEKEFGYLDNVIDTAEIFHLWVIEGDKKYAEEIPFHKIGLNVLWTDDVTPYKKRKVRILNGAHTMMVLAAHLAGLETVKEAMDDELVYSFMKQGIFEEIIPTLDLPEEELTQFANDVIERFKNPFIKHYLLSIALNSVSKYKVRVLPSVLQYIKDKKSEPKRLVFSLAALIAFYRTDAANDDADVMKYMKTATAEDILSKTEYWGENLSFLLPSIEKYLEDIEKNGIRNAMAKVVD